MKGIERMKKEGRDWKRSKSDDRRNRRVERRK
jgi:hypothetical protein